MPNTQQMTLTEQVRNHGELLAKLTVLVEEDHKDLDELKKSTEIIAKAVQERETREQMKSDAKARLLMFGVPVATTVAGVIAGHFIR